MHTSDPRLSSSLRWQGMLLLAVWIYVGTLHWDNDGLWYQGDAPRHAANGFFWKDFLSTLPADPARFALSYYVRYPVIQPAAHPPGFHLLEAAGYALWGPTPWVGKMVTLGFTLLAGAYALAWIRRWIAPEAGWAAPLMLLQTGVIVWSHGVMLNLPGMALAFGAMYHARRWIEGEPRHCWACLALLLAGMLTYAQTAIVGALILGWLLIERRWDLLRTKAVLIGAGMLGLLSSAIVVVAWQGAPLQLQLLLPGRDRLLTSWHWTYYLEHLIDVVSLPTLVLALLGLVLGPFYRRERETIVLAGWTIGTLAILSFLLVRDSRYAMLAVPPLVLLGVVGLAGFAAWVRRPQTRTVVIMAGCGFALLVHVALAPSVHIAEVRGFRELVQFFETNAPEGRILYEGHYNGVFGYYLRAGDPDFRRSMAPGHKLPDPTSPAEVADLVAQQCGCRWIVIERSADRKEPAAVTHLRAALHQAAFEHVRTFPLIALYATSADVYRLRETVRAAETLEFSVPFGRSAVVRAKPIVR